MPEYPISVVLLQTDNPRRCENRIRGLDVKKHPALKVTDIRIFSRMDNFQDKFLTGLVSKMEITVSFAAEGLDRSVKAEMFAGKGLCVVDRNGGRRNVEQLAKFPNEISTVEINDD